MSTDKETKDLFTAKAEEFIERDGYKKPIMWGICRNDMGTVYTNDVLQSTFLSTNIYDNTLAAATLLSCMKEHNVVHANDNTAVYNIDSEFVKEALTIYGDVCYPGTPAINMINVVMGKLADEQDAVTHTHFTFRLVLIYKDVEIDSTEVGYLKLYALSNGEIERHNVNLDKLDDSLTTCAWSVGGEPVELEAVDDVMLQMKAHAQYPAFASIGKLPNMLAHVTPAEDVEISDTNSVSLGAQVSMCAKINTKTAYVSVGAIVGDACTIMGHIGRDVVIGDSVTIGAGAVVLGSAIAVDKEDDSIGDFCTVGANSVIGITLGESCAVDTGVTLLPTTHVFIRKEDTEILRPVDLFNADNNGTFIKINASDYSGKQDLHFSVLQETVDDEYNPKSGEFTKLYPGTVIISKNKQTSFANANID